jgi:hypothetical protein
MNIPIFITDNAADYFRNANYGDTDVRERIATLLERQIATKSILISLIDIIINSNNLKSITNNMRYHYDQNMVQHFINDYENIFRGINYRGTSSENENLFNMLINLDKLIILDQTIHHIGENDNWGILFSGNMAIASFFTINKQLPYEINNELLDPNIRQYLIELKEHLNLVNIFLNKRKRTNINIQFNQEELNLIRIINDRIQTRLRDNATENEIIQQEIERENEIIRQEIERENEIIQQEIERENEIIQQEIDRQLFLDAFNNNNDNDNDNDDDEDEDDDEEDNDEDEISEEEYEELRRRGIEDRERERDIAFPEILAYTNQMLNIIRNVINNNPTIEQWGNFINLKESINNFQVDLNDEQNVQLNELYDALTEEERKIYHEMERNFIRDENISSNLRRALDIQIELNDIVINIVIENRQTFTAEEYQTIKQLLTEQLNIHLDSHEKIYLNDIRNSRINRRLNPNQSMHYTRLRNIMHRVFRQIEINLLRQTLETYIRVSDKDKFFVITKNKSCNNKESPAHWIETDENQNYIISYGEINNYTCYTIDELTDGFRPYGENGNFYNYRIYNTEGNFVELPVEYALQLYGLVQKLISEFVVDDISNKPEVLIKLQELLRAIQNVKDVVKGSTDYERILVETYNNFDTPIQEAIQDYLKQLFFVGMYMRRWYGTIGHYPLTENSTKRKWGKEGPELVVKPQTNILADLMIAIKILSLDAGKFIENLREVQHYDGKVRVSRDETHTLQHLLDITLTGRYCIRMASTFFIGTGAHYIKLFNNYDFEGYDIKLLSQIQ